MTNKESAEVGRVHGRRLGKEDETRKQQIARRLKLSERALEQYFQSKQAEVEDEVELDFVPSGSDHGVREKRI